LVGTAAVVLAIALKPSDKTEIDAPISSPQTPVGIHLQALGGR
jgi:hypothetical protein